MSEEQEKIQKYIIKSTPYGELAEVVKDLQKISSLNAHSPTIANAFEEYNEEHFALFPLGSTFLMIMAASKEGPSIYVDQYEKKVYTVNHTKSEIVHSEDVAIDLPEAVHELLTNLTEGVRKYVKKYFKDPLGSQVFMQIGEDGLNVHIGFTSKNIQLGNFYTGEWISKWTVNKEKIEGTIIIKAHFFEAGNVQFQQKKNFSKEFAFNADMAVNAKSILKLIESFEGEVQESLNKVYEEMPNGFFKYLRRVTPLTKTKMVWNINAIKMNRNLLGVNK